jgi:hypothetical protein
MPPGYGYLTRHLLHRATHTWLSGSASRQTSPSARNEEDTWYCTQIPRCSGPDSHNEQTPALKVPLQTELRFHSRGYEQPPHRRACGTTNSSWLAADHCSSSDNDLRSGRLNSSSDDLRADATATRPSPASPLEGRGQAIKAEEPEVRPQVAQTISSAEKPFWLPPPQHRRRQPRAYQHRTSEYRPPQSAPAGPHSHPRRKNENGTVSEHEYRPRGVRRVVRPSGAAGHSRPDRGRNAAPWPGSSSSPSPAWLEDASSAELEDGFHP